MINKENTMAAAPDIKNTNHGMLMLYEKFSSQLFIMNQTSGSIIANEMSMTPT